MEHIYTGLKYTILWIILFFVLRIINKFDMINNILLSSVIVLFFYIILNIIDYSTDKYEDMTNTQDLENTQKLENIKYDPDEFKPNPPKNSEWYYQNVKPRDYDGVKNLKQISEGNGKTRDDTLVDHFKYSDFNRLPPSFEKDDYEEGYSFMPPKDWYPVPYYPPIGYNNSSCLVQPVYTDDTTLNLKEWKQNQKIISDNINTKFIEEQLNGINS